MSHINLGMLYFRMNHTFNKNNNLMGFTLKGWKKVNQALKIGKPSQVFYKEWIFLLSPVVVGSRDIYFPQIISFYIKFYRLKVTLNIIPPIFMLPIVLKLSFFHPYEICSLPHPYIAYSILVLTLPFILLPLPPAPYSY